LAGVVDSEALAHQKALAVVESDTDKIEPQVNVTSQSPGRIAGKDVNGTRLQSGEALLGGQWYEMDSVSLAQHSSSQSTAIRHIETRPVTILVGCGKSRQACVHATFYKAAALDIVKRAGRGNRR